MRIKTNKQYLWTAIGILLPLVIVLTAIPAQAGQDEKVRETFMAFAVAMGTTNPPIVPAGQRTSLQITITRWSTPEERGHLIQQLVENGPKALRDALQKQEETGFVRATAPSVRGAMKNFPREVLRYAWQFPGEGGKRRIVLALDRYISMAEAIHQPRWRDYDISFIVLDVDAENKGEGQLAMAVQMGVDHEKKQLVIENFGTEPVRLMSVHKTN